MKTEKQHPETPAKTTIAKPARRILLAVITLILAVLVARAVWNPPATADRRATTTLPMLPGGPIEVDPPAADGPTFCGEYIQSLNELNRKAADKAGAFVLLAGQDADQARQAVAVIEKTASVFGEQGIAVGLFTLREDSQEYLDITRQIPPPSLIVLVKSGGLQVVSGSEITGAGITQAFLAAASAQDACCPGCNH